MCAIHIPARETKKDPQVSLGKQFAAPIKKKLPRAKRGKARENVKNLSAFFPGGIAVKPMPVNLGCIHWGNASMQK